MNFGETLEKLKAGKKIKRAGWSGHWFINDLSVLQENSFGSEGKDIHYTSMIVAKLATGGYAPAQAYQADLLAEDWEVVE